MTEQTTVLTDDAIPTMNDKTKQKVKKAAAYSIGAIAVILLIDDQVKKFKNRKNVTVTVKSEDAD